MEVLQRRIEELEQDNASYEEQVDYIIFFFFQTNSGFATL